MIFTYLYNISFNFIITHQKDHENSDLCFFWYILYPRRDNCSIPRDLTKPHINKVRTYLMIIAINLLNNTQFFYHNSQYFKEYPSPFVINVLITLELLNSLRLYTLTQHRDSRSHVQLSFFFYLSSVLFLFLFFHSFLFFSFS